jgi:hypothetical protein
MAPYKHRGHKLVNLQKGKKCVFINRQSRVVSGGNKMQMYTCSGLVSAMAYVSIRQHTSAYFLTASLGLVRAMACFSSRLVSICHTSAYVSIRQHT